MRRVFLTALAAMICMSALPQGMVIFSNWGAGANAPVFDTDGTTKLGSAFEADLYWAPGTVTDSTLLTALNQPAVFGLGPPGSGYFTGGVRNIPYVGIVTAQVRVWDIASGGSWEQASTVPNARIGESALFSQTVLTGGGSPPYTLDNMPSFSLRLVTVPEPSAIALAGLGPAVMLVLRRYLQAGLNDPPQRIRR